MSPAAAPVGIRFEHHTDDGPVLGIGTPAPRLSWYVPAADDGYRQCAYQVEIVRSGRPVELTTVDGAEQVLVPWPGEPLAPREAARVRIRVCGPDDRWSAWSEHAVVEAAPDDWAARFISPATLGGPGAPAPVLTGTVVLPQNIVRGRLYATAHGVYLAELNGARVGDHELAPGWTSYQHRLRLQTYDVTGLVRPGENRLDVLLGNGWWRGRLGFQGRRGLYGDRLALLAQLEVTTADSAVHRLATDGSWTASESGVLADDLYDGQRTDLRHREPRTGAVEVVDADLGLLVAPDGPPVRVTGTLDAVRVWTSPAGRTLVDFGQNLVGRVRLRVRGLAAGREVVVRHAEVLEDGELGVRPLRTARATDAYVVAGPDEAVLEPALTLHGFRYAEVTGVPGLGASDLQAVVVGSDLRRTGWFTSSHELLNRLHDNVVWGMRGNFVDVPTDCPQRDERLGWTGDIQVFSPTATFLYDSAGFLAGWLKDLAAEQQKDGSVPFVIPDVLRRPGPATAAWGDAATIVPWVLYRRTGDLGLLERQLPSMRAWVDRVAELAGPDRIWAGGFQFGDWLDPAAPPDSPFQARADPDVVATAHLARSAEIVAGAAGLLGDEACARRYELLAAQVRAAFGREYVTTSGRVLGDAATTYALALQWALLPAQAQRRHAGRRLADLVRTAGFRIGTGFVGTPLMTDALTDAGEPELAYRLLLQTGCPSWLYPVTMGATTVWERWDSMLPDGSVNPGEMTSFNHYALGSVADWLHRRVAGLAPAAPGYRRLLVRPVPNRRLTAASAEHLTPYGRAAVSWQRGDGRLTLRVSVPVGAEAEVHVPGAASVEVRHGDHEWTVADPCATEPELPAEPTIREVMDHETAWDQVVAAARAAGFGDEADLAGRLGPYLDAPATGLADAATAGGFVPGGAELRARLENLPFL